MCFNKINKYISLKVFTSLNRFVNNLFQYLLPPMQLVHITTNVASSNFALVRCIHLQHYVKKFVSDLRQVMVSPGVIGAQVKRNLDERCCTRFVSKRRV
jgi:hypothetical protein